MTRFDFSDMGFTLVEQLVGTLVSSMVIFISAYTLSMLVNANQQSISDHDARVDLNRALDFMASEIRQSAEITADLSQIDPTSLAEYQNYAASTPVTEQFLFALKIPGFTEPVIYFAAPSTAPWGGPISVSRWGLKINTNGDYEVPLPGDVPNVLIDLISDDLSAPGCINLSPPTPMGAFACLEQPTGRIAEIFLTAKSNNFTVKTKVFARAK